MSLPSTGKWLVRILARENRFVVGLYRRHMKVISYLGTLDRVFGVPATTRNWNTITAIAKVLDQARPYGQRWGRDNIALASSSFLKRSRTGSQ